MKKQREIKKSKASPGAGKSKEKAVETASGPELAAQKIGNPAQKGQGGRKGGQTLANINGRSAGK